MQGKRAEHPPDSHQPGPVAPPDGPGTAPDHAARDAESTEPTKPDEDRSVWLKEGAGAPDAADIEDPEAQL